MPAGSLREDWEDQALAWTEWARRPGHDSYWRFHRAAFLSLLPAPGRLTLDIGTGEGRVARDLAGLGHRVVAVEPSPSLAAQTRAAGGGLLGVVRADGARLPFPDGRADLAVAFMVLHDVDELDAVVSELARVLSPGGRLCAAIVHPINSAGRFAGPEADAEFVIGDDYFADRPYQDDVEKGGLRMRFSSRHRPLERLFAALEPAGLLVETVREPRPDSGGQWDRAPLFLDFRAVRP
jgi:SAM-dependent methyltransferase